MKRGRISVCDFNKLPNHGFKEQPVTKGAPCPAARGNDAEDEEEAKERYEEGTMRRAEGMVRRIGGGGRLAVWALVRSAGWPPSSVGNRKDAQRRRRPKV